MALAHLGQGGQVAVTAPGRPERVLQADVVLMAPGSRPVRPASIPFDGSTVLDPRTSWPWMTRSEAYKYAAYDSLNRVDVRAAFGDT